MSRKPLSSDQSSLCLCGQCHMPCLWKLCRSMGRGEGASELPFFKEHSSAVDCTGISEHGADQTPITQRPCLLPRTTEFVPWLNLPSRGLVLRAGVLHRVDETFIEVWQHTWYNWVRSWMYHTSNRLVAYKQKLYTTLAPISNQEICACILKQSWHC